jgi:hypothetical protein
MGVKQKIREQTHIGPISNCCGYFQGGKICSRSFSSCSKSYEVGHKNGLRGDCLVLQALGLSEMFPMDMSRY